jgi:hypothetical protein
MDLKRTWVIGLIVGSLSFSVSAAQPPNSGVEYISPAQLGQSASNVPGDAHGHVRKQLSYGKGYRYGHSVSGAAGNITIFSAATNKVHGAKPIIRRRSHRAPRSDTALGPRLKYKPQYGKSAKPGYGG